MLSLERYREYWEGMAVRVPELSHAMPVTVDEQMGRRIQDIKPGSGPVLFYFPPAGQGRGGDVDSFSEGNLCVIFVMEAYDPQRATSYDVLAHVQPVVEAVKRCMLADMAMGCPVMRFDPATLNTVPETEFYRNFAGWSVGFTALTDW